MHLEKKTLAEAASYCQENVVYVVHFSKESGKALLLMWDNKIKEKASNENNMQVFVY